MLDAIRDMPTNIIIAYVFFLTVIGILVLLGFIIYEYLNLKILALILTTILIGVTIFTFDYYIYIYHYDDTKEIQPKTYTCTKHNDSFECKESTNR